jgi:anti-sigma factor RsiW
MRCSDFAEWIAEKLDGGLSERKAQQLDDHLSVCPRCRAELCLQRDIRDALGEETHSGLSPDFTRVVSQRAFMMARKERRVQSWVGWVPALALGAAAVVLFFVGLEVARSLPAPTEISGSLLLKPVALLARAVFGVFAGSFGDLLGQLGSLGRLSGTPAGLLFLTIIGSLPAIWGFHKVYVFMKE